MSLVDITPSVTTNDLITTALTGVKNGNLSCRIKNMGDTNSIQIPLFPYAGNVKCLAEAYNRQAGLPFINQTTLLENTEYTTMVQELEKEHGLRVIDANKPSDATEIILILEKHQKPQNELSLKK